MNYTELYQLLETYTGQKHDDSTPNFSLSNDLGIYGDDAYDLLLAFSKKFNVDISTFKLNDYFEGEGDIISKFMVNQFNMKKPKKDLRINDLKSAIQSGKLI